jgi:hypothetical protein
MSTTPESSPEPSAPALTFANKREKVDTRWGPGVVAAIIAAIALVAAGVTAAVVLSKKPPSTEPPDAPLVPMSITSSGGGPLKNFHAVKLLSTSTPLAGSETVMAAGKSVQLGSSGVSFDIPSGWSVIGQEDGTVGVGNKSTGVVLVAIYGSVEGESGGTLDVQKVHQALWEKLASDGMSNVKATPVKGGALKPEAQKNFDTTAQNSFSADVTTQQGSGSVVGSAMTLLNSGKNSQVSTSAGFFVFNLMMGQDEASLQASLPDVNTMISGMLGVSPSS